MVYNTFISVEYFCIVLREDITLEFSCNVFISGLGISLMLASQNELGSSFLFNCLEDFEDRCQFFFKCLAEFTSEVF